MSQATVKASNGKAPAEAVSASATGRLPDDPAAFVAEAEKATNDYDRGVIRRVFAADAVSEQISSGARDVFHGVDEISAAWEADCAGFETSRLRVEKTLISAGGDVIANTWQGEFFGRPGARGLEVWRFDAEGKVRQHHLYSYVDTGPASSLKQRMRMLLNYPRLAVTFARARGWV